jgi:hypothetical protein
MGKREPDILVTGRTSESTVHAKGETKAGCALLQQYLIAKEDDCSGPIKSNVLVTLILEAKKLRLELQLFLEP